MTITMLLVLGAEYTALIHLPPHHEHGLRVHVWEWQPRHLIQMVLHLDSFRPNQICSFGTCNMKRE